MDAYSTADLTIVVYATAFTGCGALFKVPSKEAQSPISFHDHAVNMLVPVHIFVQSDAKVLAGIFRLQVMSMYTVCCLYKTLLLAWHDVHDRRLGSIETHLPGLLPDFKSIKILLK